MSNLNDFTNPQLQLTKSRRFEAMGVDDNYNQVILESDTVYIRILSMEKEQSKMYTLTLDGTTPNTANENAIQVYHHYLNLNKWNEMTLSTKEDSVVFESKVVGGATLKMVYSGAGHPFNWGDRSGISEHVLIEQYSY